MSKFKAQGLVEFVFIIPLVILLMFGIIELAIYLRAVNTVENIATETAVVAARQTVDETQDGTDLSNTSTFNQAVGAAFTLFDDRIKTLGLNYASGDFTVTPDGHNDPPYTAFDIASNVKKSLNGVDKPIIKIRIDYTDPYKTGVTTQVTYEYTTLFLGMSFNLLNNHQVTIIPRDIEIQSSQAQQFIKY